jgi:hypothetical protein
VSQKLIDEAPKNTYFWNLIVSPDPNGEENANRKLNLQQLTKDLIKSLEQRLNRPLEFVGTVQNDHTDIPHVHALVLIQRRGREMLITRETLADLRMLAAGKALEQQADRAQVRSLIPQRQQQQAREPKERAATVQRETVQPLTGSAGGRATQRVGRPLEDCYRCGMPWHRFHECEEELELTLKLK